MADGSICLVPVIQSVTGPASFQLKLKAELQKRGFIVHHDPQRTDTGVILVIAASRHIGSLLQARRRGVRIVQRLNGINWIHRKRTTGAAHFIRAELRNLSAAGDSPMGGRPGSVPERVCPWVVAACLWFSSLSRISDFKRNRFNCVFPSRSRAAP